MGEPFLFKLHAPDDYIVGGGFFSHSTILPATIVWRAFGEKNGARTEEEMRARIARYRRIVNPKLTDDFEMGSRGSLRHAFVSFEILPVRNKRREGGHAHSS